jgi:hypothetical protein
MINSRDDYDCPMRATRSSATKKVCQVRALAGEHLPARSRDPVIPPSSLSRLLDPASLNQPLLLEAIEGGIQRCDMKADRAVGPLVD